MLCRTHTKDCHLTWPDSYDSRFPRFCGIRIGPFVIVFPQCDSLISPWKHSFLLMEVSLCELWGDLPYRSDPLQQVRGWKCTCAGVPSNECKCSVPYPYLTGCCLSIRMDSLSLSLSASDCKLSQHCFNALSISTLSNKVCPIRVLYISSSLTTLH